MLAAEVSPQGPPLGDSALWVWEPTCPAEVCLPSVPGGLPSPAAPRLLGDAGVGGRLQAFGIGAAIQRGLPPRQPGSCPQPHWSHLRVGTGKGASSLPSHQLEAMGKLIKDPEEKEPVFPFSVFQQKIFSPPCFCKLGRELTQGSVSVKLFGEQE